MWFFKLPRTLSVKSFAVLISESLAGFSAACLSSTTFEFASKKLAQNVSSLYTVTNLDTKMV